MSVLRMKCRDAPLSALSTNRLWLGTTLALLHFTLTELFILFVMLLAKVPHRHSLGPVFRALPPILFCSVAASW